MALLHINPQGVASESVVTRYLADLRSKHESVRTKAAKNLRIHVEAEAREMSAGTFTKFMTDLNKRLYELVMSKEQHEKLGGIIAMDELIDVHCDENETKIIRFANYLRTVFQQPVDQAVLPRATRALGHLVRAGGNMTADFVEFELRRSLEWLIAEPRSEYNRFAAVMILKELANNAPVQFHAHVPAFFDKIWVAIQGEPKANIREAAVGALRAVLQLLASRQPSARNKHQWYFRIWEKAHRGFLSQDSASLHGSLLAVGELLDRDNTGEFLAPRFNQICELIYRYRNSKHRLVQRTVLILFPTLARFDPQSFNESGFLSLCMEHLLGLLRSDSDFRDQALKVAGDLALEVGEPTIEYVAPLISHVHAALSPGYRNVAKKRQEAQEALKCLSKLGRALGARLAGHVESLIDQMFAGGLSVILLDALGHLSRHIPSLLPVMQSRLLACISTVLAQHSSSAAGGGTGGGAGTGGGTQLVKGGGGAGRSATDPGGAGAPVGDSDGVGGGGVDRSASGKQAGAGASAVAVAGDGKGDREESSTGLLLLALNALGQFGLDECTVTPLVCECCLRFLDHPDPLVRREAALAATKLLLPRSVHPLMVMDAKGGAKRSVHTGLGGAGRATGPLAASFPSAVIVCKPHQLVAVSNSVLRVLTFAVSEPESPTRESVLAALDARFDPILCQPACLEALQQTLHDENLPVRKVSIRLMGRLSVHNPAAVMPSLRRALLQLLTELDCLCEARQKEEAAELLGDLLVEAHPVLEPYCAPVLCHLLAKLKEATAAQHPLPLPLPLAASHAQQRGATAAAGALPLPVGAVQTGLQASGRTAPAGAPAAGGLGVTVRGGATLALPSTAAVAVAAPVSASLALHLLTAIGQLSEVGGPTMTPFLKEVMPLLLDVLQDPSGSNLLVSHSKREGALRTLRQLCENTGYVIAPYTEYPYLLWYLISLLRTEVPSSPLRFIVMSVIGTLGALDPFRYQQLENKLRWGIKAGGPSSSPVGGAKRESAKISTAMAISGVAGEEERMERGERDGLKRGEAAEALRGAVVRADDGGADLAGVGAAGVGAMGGDRRGEEWQRGMGFAGLIERGAKLSPLFNIGAAGMGFGVAGLVGADSCPSDIFSVAAVAALMKMLQDAALASQHHSVIQALMYVFPTLDTKRLPGLMEIMPAFLQILRKSDFGEMRETLLRNMAQMIAVARRQVAPFMGLLLEVLASFMRETPLPIKSSEAPPTIAASTTSAPTAGGPMQGVQVMRSESRPATIALTTHPMANGANPTAGARPEVGGGASVAGGWIPSSTVTVNGPASPATGGPGETGEDREGGAVERCTIALLAVLEEASRVARDEFLAFVGGLLPYLLAFIRNDLTPTRQVARQTLQAFVVFGVSMQDYMHLVVPTLAKIAEGEEFSIILLRIKCVETLGDLAATCSFPHFVGRIAHPLVRILDAPLVPTTSSRVAGGTQISGGTPSAVTGKVGGETTGGVDIHGPTQLDLKQAALDTLARINSLYGAAMAPFVPLIRTVAQRQNLTARPVNYGAGERDMTKGGGTAVGSPRPRAGSRGGLLLDSMGGGGKSRLQTEGGQGTGGSGIAEWLSGRNLEVNQQNLRAAWDTAGRTTKDEWTEWMRRFSLELLRESPSPSLRACWSLAQVYQPLSKELFPVSFLSCWLQLFDAYQDFWGKSLERALRSTSLPPDVLQAILNLAEFMEQQPVGVAQLPIDRALLGELAEKSHAYAKALYYKEQEFRTSPESSVEALISLNNQLQQGEAARGVLEYAQKHLHVTLKESWYEKLQRWEDALEAYELRQLGETLGDRMLDGGPGPDGDFGTGEWGGTPGPSGVAASTLGASGQGAGGVGGSASAQIEFLRPRLRCLHALGEWERLARLAEEVWSSGLQTGGLDHAKRQEIAHLAAAAEFNRRNWSRMAIYVQTLEDSHSYEAYFYSSVLAIHRQDFRLALRLVQRARETLDPELTALVGESYLRAYSSLVRVQELSELEEVIKYRQCESERKKRHMRNMWARRLEGMAKQVDVWQSILQVRSIVLPPNESVAIWLHFASLCRKQERLPLAIKVIDDLAADPLTASDPRVRFGKLKNIYTSGGVVEAQQNLKELCQAYDLVMETQMMQQLQTTQSGQKGGVGGPSSGLPPIAPALGGASASASASHITASVGGGPGSAAFGFGGGGLGHLGDARGDPPDPGEAVSGPEAMHPAAFAELLSKCHLKLALWTREICVATLGPNAWQQQPHLNEIVGEVQKAVQLKPNYYKAWNTWALLHFGKAQAYDDRSRRERTAMRQHPSLHAQQQQQQKAQFGVQGCCRDDSIGGRQHEADLREAVRGFIKSISLRPRKNLQDTLRLLTIWFTHAGITSVDSAVQAGFATAPLDTWLGVIPQVLARLRSNNKNLQTAIRTLLRQMSFLYPEALVFPLTVASNSSISGLADSATQLLEHMSRHAPELVQQSKLVSRELVRVSVLWHEKWHEALEEASRLHYNEADTDGMVALLLPLHKATAGGTETLREVAFVQSFGRELEEAHVLLKRYQKATASSRGGIAGGVGAAGGVLGRGGAALQAQSAKADIEAAWAIYYRIFQRLHRQINCLSHLDLQYVSPALYAAKDLQLPVPCTYSPDRDTVRIKSFSATVNVVMSKQKPRIVQVNGSDGNLYKFLLKGHEDLKQDERVMQLFGLINDLLGANPEAGKKDLSITRFAVVPLSSNSGLIEWVPNCDTLHSLIKTYRDSLKVNISLEHNLMRSFFHNCGDLCLLQKVECFRYALDSSSGEDLARVLWLQSRSSEVWLSRRTIYSRSLAVMSMVGYILGLGDRHPSNLMLRRSSGRVVHIDFGDCFDVAAFREKFPEKIPFRLTRMLLNALEVSGVEGNFRVTCEQTMGVLRSSKDTVMAMLEAFVYDPLITWRLLPANRTNRANPRHNTPSATAEAAGAPYSFADITAIPLPPPPAEADAVAPPGTSLLYTGGPLMTKWCAATAVAPGGNADEVERDGAGRVVKGKTAFGAVASPTDSSVQTAFLRTLHKGERGTGPPNELQVPDEGAHTRTQGHQGGMTGVVGGRTGVIRGKGGEGAGGRIEINRVDPPQRRVAAQERRATSGRRGGERDAVPGGSRNEKGRGDRRDTGANDDKRRPTGSANRGGGKGSARGTRAGGDLLHRPPSFVVSPSASRASSAVALPTANGGEDRWVSSSSRGGTVKRRESLGGGSLTLGGAASPSTEDRERGEREIARLRSPTPSTGGGVTGPFSSVSHGRGSEQFDGGDSTVELECHQADEEVAKPSLLTLSGVKREPPRRGQNGLSLDELPDGVGLGGVGDQGEGLGDGFVPSGVGGHHPLAASLAVRQQPPVRQQTHAAAASSSSSSARVEVEQAGAGGEGVWGAGALGTVPEGKSGGSRGKGDFEGDHKRRRSKGRRKTEKATKGTKGNEVGKGAMNPEGRIAQSRKTDAGHGGEGSRAGQLGGGVGGRQSMQAGGGAGAAGAAVGPLQAQAKRASLGRPLDAQGGAGSGNLEIEKDPHMHTAIRETRQRELKQMLGPEGIRADPEVLSAYARAVLLRVEAKLAGTDFGFGYSLDVAAQVDRLIQEAASHENLCQCYTGWCPFW